jgi:hypothetical protein
MALAVLALGLGVHLLVGPVRSGWGRMGTDFPNYYTGAVLVRQGAPLRLYYDWTWFQRQIHYAGIDGQLGGYIPFTPATMLPFVPLTFLEPQTAKRVWLVLEFLFLATAILLLSRYSGLTRLEVTVLALLAHSAVGGNFAIGQYYIFVLLLLTCAAGCLLRGREGLGGVIIGLIFAVKLYTAPFLLFFAIRRQWRAFGGFVFAVAGFTLLSIVIFGWPSVWFFATTVLPRGLDGSVLDPYNPGWASMTAFLRHSLFAEAELNPHPLVNAPAAFFFLRAFYTLGVLAVSLLILSRPSIKRVPALALFTIVLFVLSPNMASYHYILLLVPVALLLKGAPRGWSAGLILLYVAVELPLYSWDARFFPKAWLLLLLALYAGSRFWSGIRPRVAVATLGAVALVATADTVHRLRLLRSEPPQVASHAAMNPGSIYSGFPTPAGHDLLYEAIDRGGYVIRQSGASAARTFSFDGDAFHPTATADGASFYVEVVSGRHSRIARVRPPGHDISIVVGPELNPSEPAVSPDGSKLAFVSAGSLYLREGGRTSRLASSGISTPAFFPDGRRIAFAQGPPGHRIIAAVSVTGGEAVPLVRQGDCTEPSVSPNGQSLAFACEETGAINIWMRDLTSGQSRRLTAGSCSSLSPAWTPDSRFVTFASDCNRGLGLTALYRVAVNQGLRKTIGPRMNTNGNE